MGDRSHSRLSVRLVSGQLGHDLVADVHAERHQLLRSERVVPDHDAPGVADSIAERDCPEMLDRQHERRAAVRQRGEKLAPTASAAVGASASTDAPSSAPASAPSAPAMPSPTRAPTAARSSARWSSSRSETLSIAMSSPSRTTNTASTIRICPTSLRRAELFRDPTLERLVVRKADHERLDGSDGHDCILLLKVRRRVDPLSVGPTSPASHTSGETGMARRRRPGPRAAAIALEPISRVLYDDRGVPASDHRRGTP